MASSVNDVEGGKGGSLAFPEEQAPANNVSATDASSTSRRKKKLLLAAIAALALVGLVVGLSVGLTRNKNGSSAADDAATAPTTQASAFVETQAVINNVCSKDDTTKCEEACQPVDCCNPFNENNCLMDEAEKCMEYAKCHVVKELKTLGAPANLTDICSKDDKSDCTDACQDVKCCYDGNNKCQDSQFLTCIDYAACQVLNKNSTVDPAPVDLLETCTDPDKVNDCETACEEAACCWDPSNANCLQTDMITCLTYAPCGSLLLQMPNTVVDFPDEAFTAACSVDSVLTENGYNDCEKYCGEASCCSADDESNCFASDPIGCLQHLQCGLLALAGGTVPKADPEELQTACDLQDILNGGSMDSCQKACEAAACCVAQGNDNCLADGNALACATYAPCLPVLLLSESGLGDIFSGGGLPDFTNLPNFGDGIPDIFGEGTIDAPPDDLSDTCSVESLATEEGRAKCEEVCKEVECCTSTGNDNCLLENIIMCATWNLQGCFAVSSNLQV